MKVSIEHDEFTKGVALKCHAASLAKQFGADIPSPRDLVNLNNHELFVRMMIDGEQSKSFSARTSPNAA